MAWLAVKAFKFDATNWGTDGDGAIVSTLATVTDPVTSVPWGLRTWGRALLGADIDANGDYILFRDFEHEMMDGEDDPTPYSLNDIEFYWWIKRTATWNTGDNLTVRIRLNTLTEDQLTVHIDGTQDNDAAQRLRVLNEDGGAVLWDTASLASVLPLDEWRMMLVRVIGATMTISFLDDAGLVYKTALITGLDRTDPGTVGLLSEGESRIWTTGNATKDKPSFAVAKSGTVRLYSMSAWTLPMTFTGFDRMFTSYDRTYDSEQANVLDVTLYYNLHTSGAWSGWMEAPVDGDMSGVSANASDMLLVGLALTNESQYRTRPAVSGINVTYYREAVVSGVSTMRQVANAIKDDLDANETITAFTGWDAGKGCIVCYESQRDAIPLNKTAGIFICMSGSPFEEQGDGKTGTEVVIAGMTYRELSIYPTVQVASSSPSAVATSDDGLEALTEAVWEALKVNSLNDAVHWMELDGIQNDVGGGFRKDKVYTKADRIGVRAFVGVELV